MPILIFSDTNLAGKKNKVYYPFINFIDLLESARKLEMVYILFMSASQLNSCHTNANGKIMTFTVSLRSG